MSTPSPIDHHRKIPLPLDVPRHDPGLHWRLRFRAFFRPGAFAVRLGDDAIRLHQPDEPVEKFPLLIKNDVLQA